MGVYIHIAGVDRTTDVTTKDFLISREITHKADNFNFGIVSGSAPTVGEEIIVYSPTTAETDKEFAGIIDASQDSQTKPGKYVYKGTARDYTYVADKRLVNAVYGDELLPTGLQQQFSTDWGGTLDGKYELSITTDAEYGYLTISGGYSGTVNHSSSLEFNVVNSTINIIPSASFSPVGASLSQIFTADEVFKHIVATYCTAFTVNNVQANAPETGTQLFPYKRPSECFTALGNYVGWSWKIDYDKDFHFFPSTAPPTPAPMAVTSTNAMRFTYRIDREYLRNRTFVKGGTYLSDDMDYEIKADGVARAWTLPNQPENVRLFVGSTQQLVGIDGVDSDTTGGFHYMVNPEDKSIRALPVTTTLSSGVVLRFLYKYPMRIIERQDDFLSQRAIKAIEGGDGIYEHIIEDDSLTTLEAARAMAQNDLRQFANPKITGQFEILSSGFDAGQSVHVTDTGRGIDNDYVIQRVDKSLITLGGENKLLTKVTFGGRLIGVEDYLMAIISAQQAKKAYTVSMIESLENITDDIIVTDTMTPSTVYDLPYVISTTSNNLCGFILVSTGAGNAHETFTKNLSGYIKMISETCHYKIGHTTTQQARSFEAYVKARSTDIITTETSGGIRPGGAYLGYPDWWQMLADVGMASYEFDYLSTSWSTGGIIEPTTTKTADAYAKVRATITRTTASPERREFTAYVKAAGLTTGAIVAPSDDGYWLERKIGSAGEWTVLTQDTASPWTYADTTNFTVGTTYFYRVREYVGGAYQGYSDEKQVVFATATTHYVKPEMVANVKGGGLITATTISPVGWHLERKIESGGTWETITVTESTSFADNDAYKPANVGKYVYYRVREYALSSGWGNYSNEDSVLIYP